MSTLILDLLQDKNPVPDPFGALLSEFVKNHDDTIERFIVHALWPLVQALVIRFEFLQ